MKRKFFSVICTVIAMLMTCTVFLAGCFGSSNNTPEDTTPKEYTIQYTDDSGTHQITVTAGMPYSLDVVPEKTGYTFTGLFDAEVGGTQYVSASGASLSAFTDGKNMVLFPQFKAKDYTVILDYQGATVTGSRQLTVAYGSSLPELPKNLTSEHKEFAGWYTKANCEGTQIADEYGLIPVVSVLNDTNFDLSGEYVYLYAGFEIEKFTVTCCFEAGMDTEDVQVEYDTPASQIVPKTRVNGEAPLTWSKTQGGEVWNGKVTDDMVLYAVEYAPVIELDLDGGKGLSALVARAGSTIALPIPTKDLANFSCWVDMQGKKYTSTTMPSTSLSLKAVWQAKLVFDENGGTNVSDISETAGTTVSLPIPEREGYIFAGWYDTDRELYTMTTMPATGIALKAGWYKAKNITITVVENNIDNKLTVDNKSLSTSNRKKLDLVVYLPNIPTDGVRISYKISFRWGCVYTQRSATGTVALYEGTELNSNYQLASKSLSHTSDYTSYCRDSLSGISIIKSNILYFYYAGSGSGSWGSTSNVAYYDVSLDLTYPNTTNLYL